LFCCDLDWTSPRVETVATMASSKFVFPNLKNSDIVLCMNELGVSFSEEDLQKPTPQRMQMVYEAFADILMGYTRESFDSNVRACANEVENFVCPLNTLT
jgi:Nuf2 family